MFHSYNDRPYSLSPVNVLLRRCSLTILMVAISYYIGKQMVLSSLSTRTLLGYLLILLVVSLSLRNRSLAIYLVTVYLPLLGLIRRVLIPISGWTSLDPLVLLGPVTALLFGSFSLYRRFILNEQIADDTSIFKLVRWMILIEVLEIGNPRQGSPLVGLGGVLFYIVPLFWFLASRNFIPEKWIKIIVHSVFAMGVLTALYGLKQTFYGFYPFEEQWLTIAGYTALHVGGQIRALSTFDNQQEYAAYLQIALVIGWLYILKGTNMKRLFGIVGVGIIGYALFMESVRAALITSILAIGIITVISAGTFYRRIVVGCCTTAIVTGGIVLLTHLHPVTVNNNLANHSLGGLTSTFNPKTSSLGGHAAEMFSGILRGLKSVIGLGLGSTTTAAGKFSSSNSGTEVDISNMFVSNGIFGGLVYIVLVFQVFVKGIRVGHNRSFLGMVCLGTLLSTLGQWINGELYSSSTLIWILIGYLDRQSLVSRVNSDDIHGGE